MKVEEEADEEMGGDVNGGDGIENVGGTKDKEGNGKGQTGQPRAGGSKRGFPWELVRDILAAKGPRKVTVDLKPQLRAMGAADAVTAAAASASAAAAASAASSASGKKTSCSSVGVVGTVAGPVVDVRVAGWLLHPDADELSCGFGTGWVKLGDGFGDGGGGGGNKNGLAETLLRFFGGEVDATAVRASSEWSLGLTESSRRHAAAANTAATAAAVLAVDAALQLRLARLAAGTGRSTLAADFLALTCLFPASHNQ